MTRNSRITTSRPGPDNEDEFIESLQNIPSTFDLALNGSRDTKYMSSKFSKEANVSLLDPEEFRRISIGSITSQQREAIAVESSSQDKPKTWKSALKRFWHRNQGLFYVTFSQLFGALMNVTARLLELEEDGFHPFQLLFCRMSLTLTVCCVWMWRNKTPDFPFGAKGVRLLLLARGASGFFGIFGMYYSLQYLAMSDAVVITFLAPSVASYACYIFLKEPFPKSAQYASLVSLFGVLLIARPVGLFASSASPDVADIADVADVAATAIDAIAPVINATIPVVNGSSSDMDLFHPTTGQRLSAIGMSLLGVLGAAGAYTSIRWIGSRAHPLISVNYFATICTIVSTTTLLLAKPLGWSETLAFKLPTGIRQWALLLFLGVCGFITQFFLTRGLAAGGKGNGARATNMIYTSMLFALALDKVVFGKSPGWWSIAGSGLILGSAIFIAAQKQTAAEPAREVDEEMELGNREEGVILLGREDTTEMLEEPEIEAEREICREEPPPQV